MPVIRINEQKDYPEWSDTSHYGINHPKKGQEVELHYHNCNEYWIIVSGRGICTTEGDTYEIGPGDMVLTKEGDEHSLVVTEDMTAIYFYGKMAPGGKIGHLHREKKDG